MQFYKSNHIRTYEHTHILLIHLLSHGSGLHNTSSKFAPSQKFPPQDGTGLLHILEVFSTPPPHGSEQFPLVHSLHPP